MNGRTRLLLLYSVPVNLNRSLRSLRIDLLMDVVPINVLTPGFVIIYQLLDFGVLRSNESDREM
jgi:hypothetical protein